ncbi:DUF2637 domain-containing protein [Streptomyces swartbergensis]|uniref:DUF2637 domain-containing protein n=1 Tax=Streptomyces swartbergensis TaxID=487165 RepID=A0A243S663_9ACTN|nr:DUF2637 domain-containing protein [Streptomyces swartbergensis]OUD03023.1 hypothetical protein CA983_11875 [Streptomyces swartbergensis]
MSYREERRADEALKAEQARKNAELRAEQAREDRRLEVEAKLKAKEIEAEQKRKDAELRAEQARKDAEAKRRQELADKRARAQEKERKQAARRAKVAKVTRWVNGNPVTMFVGFVMVCSIVPAVISQVGALADAGVFVLLAALLSAMLEGTAWALTFMGKQAEDAGRPAGKYRVATWVTAFLAAAVNYWHWAEALPGHTWVAIVFAASSLIAIYLWDMKTHGSHGKTKEQRREEKARRKHLAARRKDHKDIAAEADRLLSALPFGSITEEEAFATAWRIKKGAEPGLSAEVYANATNARVALGAAFELGEHVRPELVRAGMLATLYNPLPHRLSEGIPTLGPTLPLPALQRPSEGATALAGIGMYGSEAASEKAREKANGKASGNAGDDASGNGRRGRSDEELEALLPEALKVAAELVAEGNQISAAALSKRLGIRRDDARRLRDRVIAERKLKLVDGDGDTELAG